MSSWWGAKGLALDLHQSSVTYRVSVGEGTDATLVQPGGSPCCSEQEGPGASGLGEVLPTQALGFAPQRLGQPSPRVPALPSAN